MMNTSNMLIALYATGFVATGSGFANFLLAEVANVEMPWPAQFGICGIFAALLWRQSVDHKEAIKDLSTQLGDKVDNLCSQLKEGQDSQLEFFRDRFGK